MSKNTGFTFYLGVHRPNWLESAGVPLFLSRRQLAGRRSLPRAIAPWALDSGGFTELSLYGRWTISARQYVDEVRRYQSEIGMLEWASIQDWMVEEKIREKTDLTIEEHQRLTIENYLELLSIAPELPWMPVLQGWTLGHYLEHIEQYQQAGIDLTSLPRVGVGSVRRRQHTTSASNLMLLLEQSGLNLHAFGFKQDGLISSIQWLKSADSMAWSYAAARSNWVGCGKCGRKKCNNCLAWALDWRERLLWKIDEQAFFFTLPKVA